MEKTPKVERRGKKRRGDSARRDGNSKPCQQTPQKTEAVGALRIVHWPAAAAVSTWSPPCYAVRYRHVSNGQLRACTCLIRLSCCYLYRPAHSWFSPFPRSGVFFSTKNGEYGRSFPMNASRLTADLTCLSVPPAVSQSVERGKQKKSGHIGQLTSIVVFSYQASSSGSKLTHTHTEVDATSNLLGIHPRQEHLDVCRHCPRRTTQALPINDPSPFTHTHTLSLSLSRPLQTARSLPARSCTSLGRGSCTDARSTRA